MPTIPSSSKTPAPRNKLPISTSQTLRTPAPPVRHILLATPLPSATRTRRRSKTSLTPVRQIQPGPEKEREREQEREEFQTPLPSAGRWEEEHSLDSITEGLDELGLGNGNEIQVLEGVEEGEEGSEGEIEYMPPKLAGAFLLRVPNISTWSRRPMLPRRAWMVFGWFLMAEAN